jgi:hypothetical protein
MLEYENILIMSIPSLKVLAKILPLGYVARLLFLYRFL